MDLDSGPTCARSRRYGKVCGGVEEASKPAELLVPVQPEEEERFRDGRSDEEEDLFVHCACCMASGPGVMECSVCFQGFHIQGGEECNPLNLNQHEAEAIMAAGSLICPSCAANRHRCFGCNKQGELDKDLFTCLLSTCNLVHCADCQRGEQGRTICPRHLCAACGGASSAGDPLIECEKCSTSYHEKCMPEELKRSKRVRYDDRKMVCHKHCNKDKKQGVQFDDEALQSWKEQVLGKNLSKTRVSEEGFYKGCGLLGSGLIMEPFQVDRTGVSEKLRVGINEDCMMVEQDGRQGEASMRVEGTGTGRNLAVKRGPSEELEGIDEDDLFGCGGNRVIENYIREELRVKMNVRKRLKIFSPHDSDPPRPIPMSKIKGFERLRKAKSQGRVSEEVYAAEYQRFVKVKQTIERFLGPILHGDRYTSFGRHFTKPEVMDKVIDKVMCYIAHGDMVVDMTCGANTFAPSVKQRCQQMGAQIAAKAFDVILPFNSEDWVQESWFNVKRSDLGVDMDHLVVGINPPFGMNGSLAGKFVKHACDLGARLVFLIVPPKTRSPEGYKVIFQDDELCRNRGTKGGREKGAAFYLPSNNLESWSLVTPQFRILERVDPPVMASLRYVMDPSPPPMPANLEFSNGRVLNRNVQVGGKPFPVPTCPQLRVSRLARRSERQGPPATQSGIPNLGIVEPLMKLTIKPMENPARQSTVHLMRKPLENPARQSTVQLMRKPMVKPMAAPQLGGATPLVSQRPVNCTPSLGTGIASSARCTSSGLLAPKPLTNSRELKRVKTGSGSKAGVKFYMETPKGCRTLTLASYSGKSQKSIGNVGRNPASAGNTELAELQPRTIISACPHPSFPGNQQQQQQQQQQQHFHQQQQQKYIQRNTGSADPLNPTPSLYNVGTVNRLMLGVGKEPAGRQGLRSTPGFQGNIRRKRKIRTMEVIEYENGG